MTSTERLEMDKEQDLFELEIRQTGSASLSAATIDLKFLENKLLIFCARKSDFLLVIQQFRIPMVYHDKKKYFALGEVFAYIDLDDEKDENPLIGSNFSLVKIPGKKK